MWANLFEDFTLSEQAARIFIFAKGTKDSTNAFPRIRFGKCWRSSGAFFLIELEPARCLVFSLYFQSFALNQQMSFHHQKDEL